MVIGITLGIVFFMLLAAAIVGIAVFFSLEKPVGGTLCCVGAFAMFCLFLCLPFSWHQVNAGEVAVVRHMGKLTKIRSAGTYFDFWMTEKYERYDAKVQTLDIVDSAYSKDAQSMDITMTVQYQIDTDKVKEIALNYGSLDALANRIRSVAIEKTKGVLSSHRAMNDSSDPESTNGIIENRETVGKEVTEVVTNALNGYYITVNTVALTNIDFSDAFEKTVEDKMIAEQQKLQADYENQKKVAAAKAAAEVAAIEAQAKIDVAQAEAKAKIEAANGDAKAQKAIAEAEAYAASIKVVEVARAMGYTVTEVSDEADTITYKIEWGSDITGKQAVLSYIQYLEYLAKWNGELPEVVTGDSGVMITVPGQNKGEYNEVN